MADYKVIDADGHVRESIAGMREFLEPRWQRRNLFPTMRGTAIFAVSWVLNPMDPRTSSRPWTRTGST